MDIHDRKSSKNRYCVSKYYHFRSTVKGERFFAYVYFSNETVSQTTVSTETNENVSFGARNHECLSKKCSTFGSRGVQA